MLFGKIIILNGAQWLVDTDGQRFEVEQNVFTRGEYYAFEVDEDDRATDLVPAADALLKTGIRPETMSFYCRIDDDGNSVEEPDTSFGRCDVCGERGTLVSCVVLTTDDAVIELQVGDWLVGGVLGKLAGCF